MSKPIICTVNQHFYYPQELSKEEKDADKIVSKLTPEKMFLSHIQNKYRNVQVYYFERNIKKEDQLIYEKKYCKDGAYLQTGLFAGSIYVGDANIQINTGYENAVSAGKEKIYDPQIFFHRMLNYVNSIYIDDADYYGSNKSVPNNPNTIIEYLFISALKKNSHLSIPREYKKIHDRGLNIRGHVNINEYLKKDVFLKDKISYTYSEQVFVKEICHIIYHAIKCIEDKSIDKTTIGKNGLASYQELCRLKQKFAVESFNYKPLEKDFHIAKNHKALNNPMYKPYKQILSYAELIIRNQDRISNGNDSKDSVYGYLLDISKLWESYLARLLELNFTDWVLDEQEDIALYKDTFFSRHNYPDLVLKRGDEVIIFDAKFKHMGFYNDDVDRPDLFQINSYVGYYKALGKKVVLAGLLYPLSSKPEKNQGDLYGIEASETKFVVTGIRTDNINSFESLKQNEEAFIQEIRTLL